ncbi:MAG: hypothetical protein U5J95_01150 [Balneolaceae bacterium]|nr:hypothetical protein [Balneolaceae bacterium]
MNQIKTGRFHNFNSTAYSHELVARLLARVARLRMIHPIRIEAVHADAIAQQGAAGTHFRKDQ